VYGSPYTGLSVRLPCPADCGRLAPRIQDGRSTCRVKPTPPQATAQRVPAVEPGDQGFIRQKAMANASIRAERALPCDRSAGRERPVARDGRAAVRVLVRVVAPIAHDDMIRPRERGLNGQVGVSLGLTGLLRHEAARHRSAEALSDGTVPGTARRCAGTRAPSKGDPMTCFHLGWVHNLLVPDRRQG
jgi:hypothetical protein